MFPGISDPKRILTYIPVGHAARERFICAIFVTTQRAAADEAIHTIVDTLDLGVEKKGDFSGVFVYKFDCVNQQYLLAYEWGDGRCLLLGLGPHENFYRDLKR